MPLRGLVRTFVVSLVGCCLLFSATNVAAEEPGDVEEESSVTLQNELVHKQLEHINTENIEQFWQSIYRDYNGFLPNTKSPSIFELVLRSDGGFNVKEAFIGFVHYFVYEVVQNLKLLGTIAILSVFCMILKMMQTAFEQSTVSIVAYSVAYLVLIIIAINSFAIAMDTAKSAVSTMVDFMLALVPLVLTLLGTIGNFTSVAMFHPLIVFLVHFIGTVVYAVIFPLLFFSVVLSIVSSYAEQYPLSNLARLFRSVSVSALGIFLTVFLSVISVQGAATAVTDGVTLRTAKYVTGNFVPVIGSLFAEAADTVAGASLLVKNAVGMAGVVILLFICMFPALKILALAFIYSLTGAVMQPLGDSPIIHCLDAIGKGMMTIFAAMATVGIMFFIALSIMISAGNISVMLR